MNPATTTQILQTPGGWGVAAFCIVAIIGLVAAIVAMWLRTCKLSDTMAKRDLEHYQWATAEVAHRGDMLKRNADALETQADMIKYLIPGMPR